MYLLSNTKQKTLYLLQIYIYLIVYKGNLANLFTYIKTDAIK